TGTALQKLLKRREARHRAGDERRGPGNGPVEKEIVEAEVAEERELLFHGRESIFAGSRSFPLTLTLSHGERGHGEVLPLLPGGGGGGSPPAQFRVGVRGMVWPRRPLTARNASQILSAISRLLRRDTSSRPPARVRINTSFSAESKPMSLRPTSLATMRSAPFCSIFSVARL